MRASLPLLMAGVIALAGCASNSDSSTTSNEPGLMARMWTSTQKLNPFDRGLKPREPKQRDSFDMKSLVAEVVVDPKNPKLTEDRQMTVTLRVTNKGKRLAQLDFNTTQRVEATIRDKFGRVIERWSDDHRFEKEAGVVSINPGERAEYNMSVATREMSADEVYTVEALVLNYDALHGSVIVTPVK